MSQLQLRRRSALLDELRQIILAMRNLSLTELQRATRAVEGQDQAVAALLQALADVGWNAPAPAKQVLLVIGSERGFCGGFNDRLAEAARDWRAAHPQAHGFLAGDRLRSRLVWPEAVPLAGCAELSALDDTIADWLRDLPADHRLTVLHHTEQGPAAVDLLPPALPRAAPNPPLCNLPAAELHRQLQQAWLRAALTHRLTHSLQQEYRWRLNQMQRARDHLDDAEKKLRSTLQRQRQAEVTTELETLMSGL